LRKWGGTHLFIDEIHRYPNLAIELKIVYDNYPELHLVFTGSSILEIYKSDADLSRRAVRFHLHGLSFREFLALENEISLEPISLHESKEKKVFDKEKQKNVGFVS